jgi:tetratricopeptide (TPR) repeat protein
VRSWQLAQPSFGLSQSDLGVRLLAILDAVTEDPFAREWWAAVSRKDPAAIKRLLARPELARLSSRDLASLADGLGVMPGTYEAELAELLHLAYDRFPGEYWVNFRMASNSVMGRHVPPGDPKSVNALRYLNAAVAARPRSGIARSALAIGLLEMNKDDPTGMRMLRAAVDIDPTSPWPAIFLAMYAQENRNWPEASAACKKAVRADADTAFLMIGSMILMRSTPAGTGPPDPEVGRLANDLIAIAPDHPGGYDMRGNYRLAAGDYRGALEDFRKSAALAKPDYLMKPLAEAQIARLEPMVRWEEKLPAVLRGEVRPANATEFHDLASYCALFEKRYVLATRFADEALKANPKWFANMMWVNEFAGWAVQAAAGNGSDAANLMPEDRTRLRRQALAWLSGLVAQTPKSEFNLIAAILRNNPHLHTVRDANELAKLPPDERAEWPKFWMELSSAASPKGLLIAPPPREVKR